MKEEYLNRRYRALRDLKSRMENSGYDFIKVIKNKVVFRDRKTGKKVRKVLEIL